MIRLSYIIYHDLTYNTNSLEILKKSIKTVSVWVPPREYELDLEILNFHKLR